MRTKHLHFFAFLATCILLFFGMTPIISAFAEEAIPSAAPAQDSVSSYHETSVFPANISIHGLDISGKTVAQARAMVNDYISSRINRITTLSVYGEHVYQYSGTDLGMTWTNPDVIDQAASYIHDGNFIRTYKAQKDLEQNPVNLEITLSYNTDFIRQQVAAISAQWTIAPVEPTISRVNGAFAVQEGNYGRTFSPDAISEEVIAAISDYSSADNIVYEFPWSEIPTSYTAADFQFSSKPLGSYSTGNLGYAERIQNISVSCENMNGTIVYPGEQASALTMYKKITQENGYALAGTYTVNGQEDDWGGGICQTTTTLYNAVLRAELQVDYRRQHSKVVSYVPFSMDAMVYAPGGSDFKFTNNLEHPVYIEAWVSDGKVWVNIWGIETRPSNRSIDFVTEVLEYKEPDECAESNYSLCDVVSNDNVCKFGSTYPSYAKQKMEVQPHPFVKSKSYKVVYVDGVETERTLLNSDTYKPMTGLLYKASDCNASVVVNSRSSSNAAYNSYGVDTTFISTGATWDPNLVPESYYSMFPQQ